MDVIPEIAPRPGDFVVKKQRWSTFYQTHLELSLRTAGIDTIMIAGGSTDRTAGERSTFVNQADSPACTECGSITVRNGACYKCPNCGATSGCS